MYFLLPPPGWNPGGLFCFWFLAVHPMREVDNFGAIKLYDV